MTWKEIKSKTEYEECLFIIIILIIAFFGITDEIYSRIHGAVIYIKDWRSLCLTVVSIQANVATLVITILSLIAGRIDQEYLGVKYIDFLLNIKPSLFKQKFVIYTELGLIVVSSFLLMGECFNVVIALFVISGFLVVISVRNIYGTFIGSEKIDKEIKAYINSAIDEDSQDRCSNQQKNNNIIRKLLKQLMQQLKKHECISNRRNHKEKEIAGLKYKADRCKQHNTFDVIDYLADLCDQWKKIIVTQPENEFDEYQNIFSALFIHAFGNNEY